MEIYLVCCFHWFLKVFEKGFPQKISLTSKGRKGPLESGKLLNLIRCQQ